MPHEKKIMTSCSPDRTRCWRTHCFSLLLLFILLFIIYANSFSGTWMFDDGVNIVENRYVHLQTLDHESIRGTFYGISGTSVSRPLSYLSFGLNYFFHGLDTWGYHLVNFSIHLLTTIFFYLFIFHALNLPLFRAEYADRAASIALLSAVLWASNPIQVTAVTYIVQRMASMAAMFFIMAMFFYLMGRMSTVIQHRIAWFGLCVLCGLLSLASKENAVMLPVVLYMLDVLLIRGVNSRTLKRELLLAFGVLGLIGVIAFALTNPLKLLSSYDFREFTLVERLLTQPRILIYYLSLMLYPVTDRFTLIYDVHLSTSLLSPWTTIPAISFWIAWVGLGVYFANKRPIVAFCMFFFIFNHLVESSVIALELIYEHRNYLPSMTIFFLIGIGVIALLRDYCKRSLLRVLVVVIVCVTIAGQGHTVVQRNSLFGHPLYMWKDNAVKSPGLSRVHNNLGQVYDAMGMTEEARQAYLDAIRVDRYHKAKEAAIPLLNLADNLLGAGDPFNALKVYRMAMEETPGLWMIWHGMAAALVHLDDLEQAYSLLDAFIRHDPNRGPIRALYSLILLKRGEYVASIQHAKSALEVDPDASLALKILGEAYASLGRYDLAMHYWRRYTREKHENLETLLALVKLASLVRDDLALRDSAVKIILMKQGRTWDDLLNTLSQRHGKEFLVLTLDPWQMLPLLRQELEMELEN